MKFLLTSGGVSNPSISRALVDLLGKPIAESSALIIPPALLPFPARRRPRAQTLITQMRLALGIPRLLIGLRPRIEVAWRRRLVVHPFAQER